MTASGRFYLLGHPVGHSKSPAMYNAVFADLGLGWEYGLADCADEETARTFLADRAFQGINITTPYKPLAYKAATVSAASAKLADGANVLLAKDDQLIAYNVDGLGCVRYLERIGVSFAGARVAVCGTGPTSLAILHAAAQAGADEVLLVGRDKDRARAVLDRYVGQFRLLASATIDLPAPVENHLSFREAYEHAQFKYGSYATSTQAIADADIIVDATPLGMGKDDPAPFDTALLSADQVVFDVVYGHGVTALVAAAQEAGCRVSDGTGMLVAQAAVSVRMYCDVAEVDLGQTFDELFEVMAAAADFDLP